MIVLLLTSQNEAELLAWNLRHHLEYGVDLIGVADNRSTDATQDVIAGFGDAVSTIRFDDFHDRQLVRMRLLERLREHHRIDWVGVSDTDEFWFAPGAAMPDLLAGTPADVVAVNFDAKLYVPTGLDAAAGPVFVQREYHTASGESPLHTSYTAGKSFYRNDWLREITDEHLAREAPHPRYRPDVAAVHHYMVRDEDQFVQKVKRLISWAPNERSWFRRRRDPRSRALPLWSAPFKKQWWGVYQAGGEPAVREYYRQHYTIPADRVAAHVEAGELVHDPAFARYAQQRLVDR